MPDPRILTTWLFSNPLVTTRTASHSTSRRCSTARLSAKSAEPPSLCAILAILAKSLRTLLKKGNRCEGSRPGLFGPQSDLTLPLGNVNDFGGQFRFEVLDTGSHHFAFLTMRT